MTLSLSTNAVNLPNLPTVTIAASATSAQTVVNFFISNAGANIYGVQVGLTNLPAGSTSSLVNDVTGWLPTVVNQGQSLSTVAMDFTLMQPVTSSYTSALQTLTVNQGNLTSPVTLSDFNITVKNSAGSFSDLKLLTTGYNVNITGSVGFVIPASAVSGNYTGGTGVNTLVFPDVAKKFSITSLDNNNFTVTNTSTAAVDTVQSFSRLKFTDIGYAYDMNGAAGQVAKILGAVFGSSAINNSTYFQAVGLGLSYLDQGMSYANVINAALTAKLGAGFSPTAEVTLLYQNLAHTAPSAADLSNYTSLITKGTFTPVSLAQFACDNALNTNNINLTGLAQSGLTYS